MKKLLSILMIIIVIYIAIGNAEIRTAITPENEEEQEEYLYQEGVKLVNKTVAIANQVSYFGETTSYEHLFQDYIESQNVIAGGINRVLNFILLPMNLCLSIFNLTYQCICILCGWDSRITIPDLNNWITGDFTSGTSYGGGGGGYTGGR